jgi:hypothetical protein
MANDKFEPQGELSEVEVKLECLRLATEFGPEFDRKDPLPKAQEYFDSGKSIRSINNKPKRRIRLCLVK